MKDLVKVLVLSCLISVLLMSTLWAQEYPDIHFVRRVDTYQMSGISGGPDSFFHGLRRFISSDSSPLQIIQIQRESFLSDDYGSSHVVENIDFDGHVELLPDFFLVRSPFCIDFNAPEYRISKINYDGYYLEDCMSYSQSEADYQTKIWYTYDENMKLAETMVKDASPLSWQRILCTRDDLGRRLEETFYTSPDSLRWRISNRILYGYSNTPFAQPYQFEKYECYMPSIILRRYTFFNVFSMDDNYPITELTYCSVNPSGGWYEPFTWHPYFYITESGIHTSYYQRSWNSLGMPVGLGYSEDFPSYNFQYESSVINSDPHVTPVVPGFLIYPNPVQMQAKVQYSIPAASNISFSTYNLKGQLIKTQNSIAAGRDGEIAWMATDDSGNRLPSGVYLLRLQVEGYSYTKKIMLCR